MTPVGVSGNRIQVPWLQVYRLNHCCPAGQFPSLRDISPGKLPEWEYVHGNVKILLQRGDMQDGAGALL